MPPLNADRVSPTRNVRQRSHLPELELTDFAPPLTLQSSSSSASSSSASTNSSVTSVRSNESSSLESESLLAGDYNNHTSQDVNDSDIAIDGSAAHRKSKASRPLVCGRGFVRRAFHCIPKHKRKRCMKVIVFFLLLVATVHRRKLSHSPVYDIGQNERSRHSTSRQNYTLYQDDHLGLKIHDGFTNLSPSLLQKFAKNSPKGEECVPIIPDTKRLFPSCNQMHEYGVEDMLASQDLTFLGNGGIRGAWELESSNSGTYERIVMKMLRLPYPYQNNWESEMESSLMETNIMSETTKSSHIMNVYGHCGNSVLNEFGGENAEDFVKEHTLNSLQKLKFAMEAAESVADLHEALYVHKDLRPTNFLIVQDGTTLKLNDFNRGNYLKWNVTDGSPCGAIPKRCYRLTSPEECQKDGIPTEKTDVFQLGNFLYFLVTQLKTPFAWFADVAYRPAMKHMPHAMQPKHHLGYEAMEYSKDPAIIAIREAMKKCHVFDPTKRTSAREVAEDLQYAYQQLSKTQ